MVTAAPAFAGVLVEPVDESQRVVLVGNTRGEAMPDVGEDQMSRPSPYDQGAVDDALPMIGLQLQLKMAPTAPKPPRRSPTNYRRAIRRSSISG